MRRPKRVDLVSLLSGVLAAPLAGLAVHLRSTWGSGSARILDWLDSIGVVNKSPPGVPSIIVIDLPSRGTSGIPSDQIVSVVGASEMSDAGYFAINDGNAIVFLVALSVMLALLAMVTAIWAEHRREPTLYLSVGYICGALAIAQVWPLAGFVCAIVGVIAVLILRRQDGNDPEIEAKWYSERRFETAKYLQREGVVHNSRGQTTVFRQRRSNKDTGETVVCPRF